jgi:hypothetical protein
MTFQANVLRVMIASPGDVAEERQAVTGEILRWNDANAVARRQVLLPVKWETHSTPQQGEHPQAIINRQLLDDADIMVAIFGTRIGTPTEGYISGTVEEIKKHVAAGKTAKIYFSDVPVPPSSLDPEQYAQLQAFRKECQTTGLYATFGSVQQLRTDFRHHLDLELNQPRYLWLSPPQPSTLDIAKDLSPDAIRLIIAAASTDGTIILQHTLGGYGLSAGPEEFMEPTPRSAAQWRAIVNDLTKRGLLGEASPGSGVYQLSESGFKIADDIESKQPTEIELFIGGAPDAQYLEIKSNRVLRLSQLDYLTSSDASVAVQKLIEEGKEIKVKLLHEQVITLFNTPRPDRNSYDHAGPAKLRLRFVVSDHPDEIVLPVMLQPKMVQNTQWVTLIGSKNFKLPV